ncbi:substrate-binding periplasmic protein [Pseudodesulfovibrio sediminis]|nr:transporter substrate-binding domain-containing protein [Pseudodesulfovibrio sediminis]
MTAPYPPYTVSNGLKVKGLSVTALVTLMEMCGTPIDQKKIKLTPWAYAYECAAREPGQILLNAQRDSTTERLYKWVGPVLNTQVVLIGRKKDKLFIPTKAHLKNYRIASVRWSRPEKTLLAGGMHPEDLKRSASHVQALRQLDRGEVDLFAYTAKGAPYLMAGLGMQEKDYIIYYTFEDEPLYFAFSKDTDDKLIHRLNMTLKELKATGRDGTSQFEKILGSQIH